MRGFPGGVFSLHLGEDRSADGGVHGARATSQTAASLLEFRFEEALGGGHVGRRLSRGARFHFGFGAEFVQATQTMMMATMVVVARALTRGLGRVVRVARFQTSVEGRVGGRRAVVRGHAALGLCGLDDLGHGASVTVTRVRVVVGVRAAALVVAGFWIGASALSGGRQASFP